jgi:hypothetical protein
MPRRPRPQDIATTCRSQPIPNTHPITICNTQAKLDSATFPFSSTNPLPSYQAAIIACHSITIAISSA